MRLIECYIENFGIYHEYSCKFESGLNCRLSENGSGKTTLSMFLTAMLFGMPESRKQSLSENERKKYAPWQGGRYGGSLTLEAGGKIYTVERSFGTKPSDDTFTLRDTAHGTPSGDYSERIGEELFGIDRDGFLRTVFLSERNLSVSNENKTISAKLSDLVGVDGDVGGFDAAIALLDERRKFYYKKSGNCEIGNTRALLSAKRAELDGITEGRAEAEARAERLVELTALRARLEEEKKALSKELLESTEQSIKKLNIERYGELEAKLARYEERLSLLDKFFGGNIPTVKEIDELRFSLIECERIEKEEASDAGTIPDARYSALSFEALASTDRALAELREKERRIADYESAVRTNASPTAESRSGGRGHAAGFTRALGLTLAAFGILLGAAVAPALYAIAAVGAVLLCTGIGLSLSKRGRTSHSELPKDDNRLRELESLKHEAAQLGAMLSEFCIELGERGESLDEELTKIKAEYTRYYTLSLARARDAEGREKRLETARSMRARAAEFLSRFELSEDDPLSRLAELTSEYGYTKLEAERAREECRKYREAHDVTAVKSAAPLRDGGELREEISRLDSELAALTREYAGLVTECDRDNLARERSEELTAEIAELEDRLARYIDTLSVIQSTMALLTEACDNMTARYIGKTKESFLKYESALGGDGGTFAVDTDFAVSRSEHGSSHSEESYSRGTRDLYSLAMRLALIDSLYESERPFIILDDPFLSLDDARVESGKRLLRELSKTRQILYFTCSKARKI